MTNTQSFRTSEAALEGVLPLEYVVSVNSLNAS